MGCCALVIKPKGLVYLLLFGSCGLLLTSAYHIFAVGRFSVFLFAFKLKKIAHFSKKLIVNTHLFELSFLVLVYPEKENI